MTAKTILVSFLFLTLAACAGDPAGNRTLADHASPAPYQLGAGDRVSVTVFGEKDLSGEYDIDDTGAIALPLVGAVKVADMSSRDAEGAISRQLSRGLVTNPKVNVAVIRYRPVFILGEVARPGAYPYYSGITVLNAVALAGGYTYRANMNKIAVRRPTDSEKEPQRAQETAQLVPGDIIIVPERWF